MLSSKYKITFNGDGDKFTSPPQTGAFNFSQARKSWWESDGEIKTACHCSQHLCCHGTALPHPRCEVNYFKRADLITSVSHGVLYIPFRDLKCTNATLWREITSTKPFLHQNPLNLNDVIRFQKRDANLLGGTSMHIAYLFSDGIMQLLIPGGIQYDDYKWSWGLTTIDLGRCYYEEKLFQPVRRMSLSPLIPQDNINGHE